MTAVPFSVHYSVVNAGYLRFLFLLSLQVNVGKGTNSIEGRESHVRDAVLHFLQHLVPVKLAAGNDGLVTVRRADMLKVFEVMRSEQLSFAAATFIKCFTARQQIFGDVQNLTSRS